jgi:hypothetical protein
MQAGKMETIKDPRIGGQQPEASSTARMEGEVQKEKGDARSPGVSRRTAPQYERPMIG